MMAALALLLHLVLMLAAAPILAGWTGPGRPVQAWRDLRRLFRKPGLLPDGAGLLGAVPVVSLGATLALATLVPSFTLGMVSSPLADLVWIGGLLALPGAASVLAAFDADAGVVALSGQRGAITQAAAAPGLLVLVLLVAVATGSTNLDAAAAALRDSGPSLFLLLPALAACVLLLSAEGGSGEAAFAGCDLAVVLFAAQLRRVAVLSIVAALLLPFGLAPAGAGVDAWVVGAACWAVKVAALGAAASWLGRLRARLRPDEAPLLGAIGLLLALIAAALFFAGQRAA